MIEIVVEGDTIPEYIRSMSEAREQIREHGYDPDDDLVKITDDTWMFGDDIKLTWGKAPDEPVNAEIVELLEEMLAS